MSSVAGTVHRLIQELPPLSPTERRELASLAGEGDVELFWSDLLRLGSKLESRDKLEAAASIYGLASQQAPEALRAKAQARLDAVEGRGAVGARVEFHLRRFSHDAFDYKMILPMMAGSAVYNLAKGAALGRFAAATRPLWWMRGAPGRLSAASLGYLAEVPAFALSSRFLHGLGNSASVPSIGQELASAALTLALLKGSGAVSQFGLTRILGARAAPGLRFAAGQAAMFGGLWSAHRLEEKLGLRSPVDGPTTSLDILSSMVSLGIGASLGRRILGEGHAARSRELAFRIDRAGTQPAFMSRLLPAPKLAAVGPPLMMMSAESGKPPTGGGGSSPSRELRPNHHSFNYTGTWFDLRAKEGSVRDLEALKEDFLDLLIYGAEEGNPLQGDFVERLRAESELRRRILGLDKRVSLEWNIAERRLLSIEVRLGDKLEFQWPERPAAPSPAISDPSALHPPSLEKTLDLYRAAAGGWDFPGGDEWKDLSGRVEGLVEKIRSDSRIKVEERSYRLNELEWLLKRFSPATTSAAIAGRALDFFSNETVRGRSQLYSRKLKDLERSFEGRAAAVLAKLNRHSRKATTPSAASDVDLAKNLVRSFLEGVGEKRHPEFPPAILAAFEERLKQESGESFEDIRNRVWKNFKVEPEAPPSPTSVHSAPNPHYRKIVESIAELRSRSEWKEIADKAEALKLSIRGGRAWSSVDKHSQWLKLEAILNDFGPGKSSPPTAALALRLLSDYMGLVLSEYEYSMHILDLRQFGELRRQPKPAPTFEAPRVPPLHEKLGSHATVLKTFDFFAERQAAWKETAARFRALHENLAGDESAQDRLIDVVEKVQETAEQDSGLTPPKVLRYLKAFELAARGEIAWDSFDELDPVRWAGNPKNLPRIKGSSSR